MEELTKNIERFADLVIEKSKDKKSSIGTTYLERIQGIKKEDFYLIEQNIFRPIGYVYSDGEFEHKFINYYLDIEKELYVEQSYMDLFAFVQEKYKQKVEKNQFSTYLETPEYFFAQRILSDFVKLLSRNIIHYSSWHNLSLEKPQEYEELLKKFQEAKENDNIVEFFALPELKILELQEQNFYNATKKAFIEKLFNKIETIGLNDNVIKNYKFFFTGIELENDFFEISDNIIIRKIKSIDKAQNTYNNSLSLGNMLSNALNQGRSTIILETKQTLQNIYHKNSYKELILESFQLFFKNLYKLEYEIIYTNDFESNYGNSCKKHEVGFLKQNPYIISNTQLSSYKKILNLMKPLYDEYNKEFEFVKIAKDFYIEALNKKTPTSQITYACLCLEALFNTSEEKISNQLKTRTSCLLKLLNLESKKSIKNNILDFYAIRSDYVHARNPASAGHDYVIAQKALDYARFSLLMFLILINNPDITILRDSIIKKDIIDNHYPLKTFINEYMLYNAIISNDGQALLEKRIGDLSWISDLNIEFKSDINDLTPFKVL